MRGARRGRQGHFWRRAHPWAIAVGVGLGASSALGQTSITVGSKAFPESWILGDALALLAESSPAMRVEHRKNLGGTEIAYQALLAGDIDAYPEYTGTVAEVILKKTGSISDDEMRRALAPLGIGVSSPLGFSDNYAVAITARAGQRLAITKISDLASHADLRVGFTHEFLGRPDGFPGLAKHYGLALTNVRGVQHELAYGALEKGELDATDIYTTDPQIEQLGLVLLDDDRGFFRHYDAIFLYRLDLERRAPSALLSMKRLAGTIDREAMMRANAAVVVQKQTTQEAARALLGDSLTPRSSPTSRTLAESIARNVVLHLRLVGISLLLSIGVGVPLGILAARSRALSIVAISFAGLLQTMPSLALLAFLIPVFGIGALPALVALFLYGLLPIVRGTLTGLTQIPTSLDEAADGIGLPPLAKLWRVQLPMASPAIMSGIKTSAVINVGTATLAALIGAEGLGNPILQGIALRDTRLILQGALPAALLALLVEVAFSLLDPLVIPRGLRLSRRAK